MITPQYLESGYKRDKKGHIILINLLLKSKVKHTHKHTLVQHIKPGTSLENPSYVYIIK